MISSRFTRLGVICLILTATSLCVGANANSPDGVQQPTPAADGSVVLNGKDGIMTLKLPAGWKQVTPKNPDILIKAEYTDNRSICVYADKKEDVVSINAYAKLGKNTVAAAWHNSHASEPTLFTFGGRPAVRYLIDYDDGTYNWTTVLLFVETPNRYCQMSVTAIKSIMAANMENSVTLVQGLVEKPKEAQK